MRILFLHNNFPAQFGAFGQYLARAGWDVWFGTSREGVKAAGISVFQYKPHRDVTEKIHPYVANFESAIINGQSAARACMALAKKGLTPDIIMAHSGWGPGLFVKEIWPSAAYVSYFEWYYRPDSPDVLHFAKVPTDPDKSAKARARNAAILMDLAHCDAGICPTRFQKDQFPDCFYSKLHELHDGVDTQYYQPKKHAPRSIGDHVFSEADEIITYVARGMEPYRGFPEIMRALEIVLAERPNAHAIIVGEDRVAYGAKLAEGDSHLKRARESLKLDWSRIHLTGLLPRPDYLRVLQMSDVHVYLTAPFVLSWSMLEAMSAGCAIIASDVEPVREVARKSSDAPLVLCAPDRAAENIIAVLKDQGEAARLGERARALISDHYDSRNIYAQKAAWLESLVN